MRVRLSGFSGEYDYPRSQVSPGGNPYYRASARKTDLPAFLNAYTLQRTIPSVRGGVTAPSPRRPGW